MIRFPSRRQLPRNPSGYATATPTSPAATGAAQPLLFYDLFQPAGSIAGQNYGWDWLEGSHCYPKELTGCPRQQVGVLPVAEYEHGDDGCSLIGLGVYRGEEYPALDGIYFSGDLCTPGIRSYAARARDPRSPRAAAHRSGNCRAALYQSAHGQPALAIYLQQARRLLSRRRHPLRRRAFPGLSQAPRVGNSSTKRAISHRSTLPRLGLRPR